MGSKPSECTLIETFRFGDMASGTTQLTVLFAVFLIFLITHHTGGDVTVLCQQSDKIAPTLCFGSQKLRLD